MKKILHFSDLHVGYPELGDRFDAIVDRVIFGKEPASDYVVVVTGDLVESAHQPGGFEGVRASLDRLEAAGFRVLAVPGNHDYGTGGWGDVRFVSTFKRTFFGDAQIGYPLVEFVEDVAFIGLDSMAEELSWYDRLFAEGEIGADQRARLDGILGSRSVQDCARRVLYMHHHPFDPRPLHQLKDSAELREVLVGRDIDAVLYGHNHEGRCHNGKWGIPRCYDAGTTTRKEAGAAPHRVIDLSRDPRLDYDGNYHGDPTSH